MRVKDFNQLNSEAQVVVIGGVNNLNEAHVLPVNSEGRLLVDSQATFTPPKISYPIRIVRNYATNPVGSTWVELLPDSGTGAVISVKIFDSSGEILELGTGAANSEQTILLIPPGGIDADLYIAANSRVVIKSYSGSTVNIGSLILQLGKEVV